MMKISLLFVFISSILFGQNKWKDSIVYGRYPDGQQAYIGGNIKLYKNIHEIIVKKKLNPCDNKKELYIAVVVVHPDKTIKLLKKQNIESARKNKCAFELTQMILEDLQGWIPAEINGEKVSVFQKIVMFPDSLFENYKEGYDPVNYSVPIAEFPGGNAVFKEQFSQKVSIDGFKFDRFGKIYLKFKVDENGKAIDFIVKPTSGNVGFDKMVINAAKSIKGTWRPATIHGVNVETNMEIPLTINDH
ncbi:energy transducer TonB [Chryseobacterium sp. R2ACT005]|uniref:energy transducer TonB n=1 Tax=Chryseobacterium sp. R2ACT005 TaxID=3416668 RepID=UPI003CF19135